MTERIGEKENDHMEYGKKKTKPAKKKRLKTRITAQKQKNGRRLKGSFTVEAAVLVPLVLVLILFVCFTAFFLYDRTALTAAGLEALQKQAFQTWPKGKEQEETGGKTVEAAEYELFSEGGAEETADGAGMRVGAMIYESRIRTGISGRQAWTSGSGTIKLSLPAVTAVFGGFPEQIRFEREVLLLRGAELVRLDRKKGNEADADGNSKAEGT